MFLCLRSIVRYFQCFVRGSSPSGKVVFHEPPLPLGNNCLSTPLPLGIYNDLAWGGGGMDIFWTHTITYKSRMPSDFKNETLHYTKIYQLKSLMKSP